MVGNMLGSRLGGRLVSLRDDSALIIDNQESANALVVANTIDSFFEISHLN